MHQFAGPQLRIQYAIHEMIYSDAGTARGRNHCQRGLNKRVAGDRIDSVWVGGQPEPLKSSAAEISSTLEGAQVERVRRVGKHIVFESGSGKRKKRSPMDSASGNNRRNLRVTTSRKLEIPNTLTWWPSWRQEESCVSLIRGALGDWRCGNQVSADRAPSR